MPIWTVTKVVPRARWEQPRIVRLVVRNQPELESAKGTTNQNGAKANLQ